ncbi:MAG: hypothetical protein HDR19_05950 [Lachnospiraceae bacterium]|nr:hypothetical protein [Lachnospiraceae bacterium]
MEQLTLEIRQLVYTVICFQCLLQFAAGSAYQRYLKLFTYFLTICMCCNVISSFVGQFEERMMSAQSVYDAWEEEWQGLLDMERIRESSSYYTDTIWNEKILGSAYEQYYLEEEGGEEDAKLVQE